MREKKVICRRNKIPTLFASPSVKKQVELVFNFLVVFIGQVHYLGYYVKCHNIIIGIK